MDFFKKLLVCQNSVLKLMGNFLGGDFCEHLPGLEVQNKSNTMRIPLWPLGKEFWWFQRLVHSKLSI